MVYAYKHFISVVTYSHVHRKLGYLNQLTFYRHVRYFAVHLWSGCGPVLNQVLLDQIWLYDINTKDHNIWLKIQKFC